MSSFYPKDEIVQSRALKVERLVIPFTVTASATAANVKLASDESAIVFMQSSGVNQISAYDSTAAAQFANQSTTDASGQLNILVSLGAESAFKVCRAVITARNGATYTNPAVRLDAGSVADGAGNPTGVSTDGQIMLYATTGVNFTTTNLDACLVVEYQVTGTGN